MTRERIVSVPFRLLLISSVTVVRALGNDSLSCFLNIGCLPSSSFSHNGVRRAGCQSRHNRASDGDVYAEDIYNDEYSKGMSSEDSVPSPWLSRRSVVQTIIASSLINAAANNPQNAAAATIDTNKPDVLPDKQCLLDLPPLLYQTVEPYKSTCAATVRRSTTASERCRARASIPRSTPPDNRWRCA